MTHGLYIGNESRPVEVGTLEELRKLTRHLTPQQRRDGWTIAPINPWPADLPRVQTSRNPLWVALGVALLVTTVVIIIQCSRT